MGIEITSQEVSQGLGRKKPIITQISPVVQFHNIREQIGSAQHNASIEFAIPKSRMFGKSSVTFAYSVKIFLNQQLVKVINADKILDQRRVVLQHYAKNSFEYNIAALKETISAGESLLLDFKSNNALRGIGQWDSKVAAFTQCPGHDFSAPKFTVFARPTFDADESASVGTDLMNVTTITKTIKSGHSDDIEGDKGNTELTTMAHVPTSGVVCQLEQTATVTGKLAGDYELSVLQDGMHVPGSPWKIRILALPPDPSKTSFIPLKFLRADKPGLSGANSTSSSGHKFLLILRDKYWNIVSRQTDDVEWAADCIFHHGGYKRNWRFHIESLDTIFSGNGRADFKPAVLADLAEEVKRAGLSRNRLAAAQIIKEKQFLERLLFVPNRKNEESNYEFHYSHALKCPLIADEKQCKGLHLASIPHGQRGTLEFSDVFFVSRRPLRGLREPIPNSDGSTHRPSILMNSNTYLWFPFTPGTYKISIRRRKIDDLVTVDTEESVPSEIKTAEAQKPIFSFDYRVQIRGSLSSEFGTIRWLLRHRIFKHEEIRLDDILMMNVWPSKLTKYILMSLMNAEKERVYMYDEVQLNVLQGKEKQHAVEVEKTHAIITDIQHFKKIWPSELSAIANFATLENVELLVYAAKLCLIADKFSEGSHEQFCSNLSLLAKSFSGLNTRNGCFFL